MVSEHRGPACLFDSYRRPVLTNTSWLEVGLPGVAMSPATPGGRLPGQLAVDLLSTATNGIASVSTVRLPFGTYGLAERGITVEPVFEFNIFPVSYQNSPAFMVLGTSRTAVDILHHALQESREFHRAFAACSADFIWQVDAGGVIDYSGPRGLLDYGPDEVFGSRITRFFTDKREAEASLVFLSREPAWEREVWLSDKSGVSHCFLVSSVPVTNERGHWQGARGIAREVTEQREREAELKKARYSQRMVNSVLHAMRSEVDPRAILDAATIVAADTAELDACLVARSHHGQALEWVAMTLPDPKMKTGFTDFSAGLLARMQDNMSTAHRGLNRYRAPAGHFLIATTSIDGTANGAVAFGRNSGGADWSSEDEHILRAMAEQLGISLAQYELVEMLREDKGVGYAI